MEGYSIEFKRSVAKDLRRISPADVEKIIARINALAEDPRPPRCEKLSAQERYRVRQGDYRIVYEVHDQKLVEVVVKVGHRSDGYR